MPIVCEGWAGVTVTFVNYRKIRSLLRPSGWKGGYAVPYPDAIFLYILYEQLVGGGTGHANTKTPLRRV